MKNNKNLTYMDTVHRDGTIWNISMMVLLLLFPVAVALIFNAAPDWRGLVEGLIATAPMYWAVGAVEVITFIPMLGAGGSYLSFVTGNIGMGIGLLVIYATITVIRQFIEPKLVAGQVGISPVVTIISMFIGIKIFGAIGIFILPFIVIIINLLNEEGIINLFKSKKTAETEIEDKTG